MALTGLMTLHSLPWAPTHRLCPSPLSHQRCLSHAQVVHLPSPASGPVSLMDPLDPCCDLVSCPVSRPFSCCSWLESTDLVCPLAVRGGVDRPCYQPWLCPLCSVPEGQCLWVPAWPLPASPLLPACLHLWGSQPSLLPTKWSSWWPLCGPKPACVSVRSVLWWCHGSWCCGSWRSLANGFRLLLNRCLLKFLVSVGERLLLPHIRLQPGSRSPRLWWSLWAKAGKFGGISPHLWLWAWEKVEKLQTRR